MKKTFEVVFVVDVEVDEEKFTDEFIRSFKSSFYDFSSLSDHMEHIAKLEARGMLMPFTEGYGAINDMGISANIKEIY